MSPSSLFCPFPFLHTRLLLPLPSLQRHICNLPVMSVLRPSPARLSLSHLCPTLAARLSSPSQRCAGNQQTQTTIKEGRVTWSIEFHVTFVRDASPSPSTGYFALLHSFLLSPSQSCIEREQREATKSKGNVKSNCDFLHDVLSLFFNAMSFFYSFLSPISRRTIDKETHTS